MAFFAQKRILIRLKKNEERALMFVYEDYLSLCVMLLEKAKLPALHIKRMRILAVKTFKVLDKLAPPF